MLYRIYILLDTSYSRVPKLEPLRARAGRINGRVKLLASRPIHKTNRVSTQPWRMIDANRVLNIYLSLNAHNWELPGAIIE